MPRPQGRIAPKASRPGGLPGISAYLLSKVFLYSFFFCLSLQSSLLGRHLHISEQEEPANYRGRSRFESYHQEDLSYFFILLQIEFIRIYHS